MRPWSSFARVHWCRIAWVWRSQQKVLASPFGGLQTIDATAFNQLEGVTAQMHNEEFPSNLKQLWEGWRLAEQIIAATSLARASEKFTQLAKHHPVSMVVEFPVKGGQKRSGRRERPHTALSSRDEIGTVLWHLWLYYFQDEGWLRLKRCPVCALWFVDTSRNRATARCSATCTWKWWSRERRKEFHSSTKGK